MSLFFSVFQYPVAATEYSRFIDLLFPIIFSRLSLEFMSYFLSFVILSLSTSISISSSFNPHLLQLIIYCIITLLINWTLDLFTNSHFLIFTYWINHEQFAYTCIQCMCGIIVFYWNVDHTFPLATPFMYPAVMYVWLLMGRSVWITGSVRLVNRQILASSNTEFLATAADLVYQVWTNTKRRKDNRIFPFWCPVVIHRKCCCQDI